MYASKDLIIIVINNTFNNKLRILKIYYYYFYNLIFKAYGMENALEKEI